MPLRKQASLTPFSDTVPNPWVPSNVSHLSMWCACVCMCAHTCAVEDTVGCLGVLWECFQTLFFCLANLNPASLL